LTGKDVRRLRNVLKAAVSASKALNPLDGMEESKVTLFNDGGLSEFSDILRIFLISLEGFSLMDL